MAIKIVVSDPKTGKTYQIETEAKALLGLKLGEKFSGDSIGISGYELQITGGSDHTGTPMRKDVQGARARRVLLTEGVGFHTDRNGERRKKRVFGNKIAPEITQINTIVVTAGSKPLDELLGKKEEAPKEGEAPAEGEAQAEPPKEDSTPKAQDPKPEPNEPVEEPKAEEKPVAEEPKPEDKLDAENNNEPQASSIKPQVEPTEPEATEAKD